MGIFSKHKKDFVSPRQEMKEAKKFSLKDILGAGVLTHSGVVKQIPFFLFLFALLVLYIANQYQGAKVMKDVIKVEKRLELLKTESITTAFERMEMSKQSEVIKLIEEYNMPLKEAVVPPYKIEID